MLQHLGFEYAVEASHFPIQTMLQPIARLCTSSLAHALTEENLEAGQATDPPPMRRIRRILAT